MPLGVPANFEISPCHLRGWFPQASLQQLRQITCMMQFVAWCRRSDLLVVLFCMVQLVVEMFAGRLQASIPFMLHSQRADESVGQMHCWRAAPHWSEHRRGREQNGRGAEGVGGSFDKRQTSSRFSLFSESRTIMTGNVFRTTYHRRTKEMTVKTDLSI